MFKVILFILMVPSGEIGARVSERAYQRCPSHAELEKSKTELQAELNSVLPGTYRVGNPVCVAEPKVLRTLLTRSRRTTIA